MTSLSIYEYRDYKKFIIDWMEHASGGGRGQRKQMAEAIGCQTPFITHVLSGDYHLSAEQAEASARWMGLQGPECEFLILLVLRQRSGTKSLETLFARQISERRERATVLKQRLKIEETLSAESQMVYYSSWHYAALHMAIMIPSLNSIDALYKYFNLPLARVSLVVEFLIRSGLIEMNKNVLRVLRPVIHLEKDSPLLNQHHAQWRVKSIESYQARSGEDLHYSAVISLSREDYEWVREKISQVLETLVERIKDSKDEKLAALNLDWFEI